MPVPGACGGDMDTMTFDEGAYQREPALVLDLLTQFSTAVGSSGPESAHRR